MSDTKVAEQIASEGGPPEASPANDPAAQQTAAEAHAQSEGGEVPAPAAAEREVLVAEDKMENKLEVNKENRPKTDNATGVAGRKEKGTPGGIFKKLMFWKKEKKSETAAATPS